MIKNLNRPDPITTLTVPHRRLIDLLEGLGFEVEVEVIFSPKSVDCYLPDYHVAFEADGPSHSLAKDRDRDAYLMVTYALPIYRLTDKELKDPSRATRTLIERFFDVTWGSNRKERRMVAYRAGALREG